MTAKNFASASFFSKLTVSWLTPFLSCAKKGEEIRDFGQHLPSLTLKNLTVSVHPEIWAPIFKRYKGTFLKLMVGVLVAALVRLFANFFLFSAMVEFLEDRTQAQWWGYVLSGLIFVTFVVLAFTESFVANQRTVFGMESSVYLRGALGRKIMKLSHLHLNSGKIFSIYAGDIEMVSLALLLPSVVFSIVILFGVSIALLLISLGVSVLPAVGFWVLMIVAEFVVGPKAEKYEDQRAELQDQRLETTERVLTSIEGLKLEVMEELVLTNISQIRSQENRQLVYSEAIEGIMNTFLPAMFTYMPPVITFGLFIGLGNSLDSSAFAVINLFSLCGASFLVFAGALQTLMQSKANFNRVSSFLSAQEIESEPESEIDDAPKIFFEEARFSYGDDDFSLCIEKKVGFSPGDFIRLFGNSGSGKTTFLLAILNQIRRTSGTLSVCGKVSYVPQKAWNFAGSIRENILCGQVMDQERYSRAIHTACFQSDLDSLEGGDLMMLPSGGQGLSGGQAQRLGIARALYANSGVLLLDDAFSALDASVSRKVVLRLRHLLEGRIIVAVTHNAAFNEVFTRMFELVEGNLKEHVATKEIGSFCNPEPREIPSMKISFANPASNSGKLNAKVLTISRDSYFKYIKLWGFGAWISILVLAGSIGILYYSSYWILFYLDGTIIVSDTTWLLVYFGLVFSSQILYSIGFFSFLISLIASNTKIHNIALRRVLQTAIGFHHRNGVGTVMSRFASDLMYVDTVLHGLFGDVIYNSLLILATIVVIGLANPIILAAPVLLLVILCLLSGFFTPGNLLLRGMFSKLRSETQSVLQNTLTGLSTIHALSLKEFILSKFERAVESEVHHELFSKLASPWFSLRLGILNSLFIFGVCLLCVILLPRDGSGALVLLYSFQISAALVILFQVVQALQALVVNLERLLQYCDLELEPLVGTDPPSSWPSKGMVEFSNVTVRYGPHLPPVTHNLSCVFQPGWHVGIVGRTGAGKSSLISALFRMTGYDGNISIDGINIQSVKLDRLRRSVSIVTQEPVMFEGSLRFNVDPRGIYPEQQIASLAQDFGLESLFENALQEVDSLSTGQKQMVCSIRALLKKSPVFVQDEGSASLDAKSEERLSRILEERTSGKTSIIIAHRLATIMKSDKVMVLDRGRIAEFRSPAEAAQNQNSLFYSLLQDSGSKDSLTDAAFDFKEDDSCLICYNEFSFLQKKNKCTSCEKLVCSFCFKSPYCFFCWKEKTRDSDDPLSLYILAGKFSIEEPVEVICTECEWAFSSQCGVCERPFCFKCTAFVRSHISFALNLKNNAVCNSCFPLLKERMLALAEKVSNVEVYAENYHIADQLENPCDLLPLKGTCIICRSKGQASMCSVCSTFVCFKETCSGLIFIPEKNPNRFANVCSRCIQVTAFERPIYGFSPAHFQLSTPQQETVLEGGTCVVCSIGFSMFISPYRCSNCSMWCCKRCAISSGLENLVCGNCFHGRSVEGGDAGPKILCDQCDLPIKENEIIWLNQRKVHASCLKQFRVEQQQKDHFCAFCHQVLVADQRVLFNEVALHAECLVKYKQAQKGY